MNFKKQNKYGVKMVATPAFETSLNMYDNFCIIKYLHITNIVLHRSKYQGSHGSELRNRLG